MNSETCSKQSYGYVEAEVDVLVSVVSMYAASGIVLLFRGAMDLLAELRVRAELDLWERELRLIDVHLHLPRRRCL